MKKVLSLAVALGAAWTVWGIVVFALNVLLGYLIPTDSFGGLLLVVPFIWLFGLVAVFPAWNAGRWTYKVIYRNWDKWFETPH